MIKIVRDERLETIMSVVDGGASGIGQGSFSTLKNGLDGWGEKRLEFSHQI